MWHQYYGLILVFTQQCLNCLFSIFPSQAGKEELKFVSQALPCRRWSSEDLAFQKLSSSFAATKKLWGTSTFSMFCTSQRVAQRNRKLFSASDSGAGKTFDPHPFEIHQNSPINLTKVWVGPRDNFLKSHLAFAKVQHIRRWGICFCFEDLRCSCCKNNRDVHPCHF